MMRSLGVFESSAALACGLVYSYNIVTKLPYGIPRLISILPVICISMHLPWGITSLHLTAISCFLFQWILPFKLLLLSFDAGPLATPWARDSLLHFVVMAVLPIRVYNEKPKQNKTSNKFLFVEAGLLSIVIWSYSFRDLIPHKIILLLYCFHLYWALDIVLSFLKVPVSVFSHLELEPQFNKPYLSTSLQDFWGRRWNLIVTNILKESVYTPVLWILWKRKNGNTQRFPLWCRGVGVVLTFLVSGLMHELIFYCMIRRGKPSWEQTAFFTLQGFLVVVEMVGKKILCPYKIRIPRFVSVSLTLGFLYMTALWLFFPPITRSGVDVKTIAEFYQILQYMFPRG